MKRKSVPIRHDLTADFNGFLDRLAREELAMVENIRETLGHETIRVLDFFPEFKQKLKAPFANSLDPALAIPTLLPFYETLIVGISPFRDEHAFARNYGLQIPTMIELAAKGRLVFGLNGYLS
jgi:hypothetical protein